MKLLVEVAKALGLSVVITGVILELVAITVGLTTAWQVALVLFPVSIILLFVKFYFF